MSLSPLAERIYQTLLRQLRLPDPLISYGDLIRALGPLPPPDANLKANDSRLFDALGEIGHACRSHNPPLPVLTSIVARRSEDGHLGTPGAGFFALVFPQVQQETARLQVWRDEVKRVAAFSYPKELRSVQSSRPRESPWIPPWLREPTVIAALIGLVGTLLTVIITVWLSSRRDEPPPPRPADPVVVKIVPQMPEPPPPRPANPPEEKRPPKEPTLGEILDALERHHQRATFGAVAGILGREPQSLFNGYARTPKTSWVVSKTTGLPTGTKKEDYPSGLLENARIIDAPDGLRSWLREHH
jgi:hypothetical protein